MATINDLEAAAERTAAASERSRRNMERVKTKRGQLSDQFGDAYIRFRQRSHSSYKAAELLRKAGLVDVDNIDMIIAFENGTLPDDDVVPFFQRLINDGTVWHLQGIYGSTAQAFIETGLCTRPEDKTAGECVPADADPA